MVYIFRKGSAALDLGICSTHTSTLKLNFSISCNIAQKLPTTLRDWVREITYLPLANTYKYVLFTHCTNCTKNTKLANIHSISPKSTENTSLVELTSFSQYLSINSHSIHHKIWWYFYNNSHHNITYNPNKTVTFTIFILLNLPGNNHNFSKWSRSTL